MFDCLYSTVVSHPRMFFTCSKRKHVNCDQYNGQNLEAYIVLILIFEVDDSSQSYHGYGHHKHGHHGQLHPGQLLDEENAQNSSSNSDQSSDDGCHVLVGVHSCILEDLHCIKNNGIGSREHCKQKHKYGE